MNNLFTISTACCLLELLIPVVTKFLTNQIGKENKMDQLLRKDLIAIKHQMGEISMVDEFAKYAKLQRQYNKLEAQLSTRVNKLMMSKMKLRLTFSYTLKFLNGIVIATLLYLYRYEPVAILPKDALWPIQGILSWPCHLENSVSLTMWFLISRLAISSTK
ncbi:guided entry of tail-anchored proteins factor 1-like [Athalia rosae]|uniref:guided entry of tail-anchored proteins factor 1-like n=1 Tax=Athalia rosae TaxID=37344 RepID=UPI0006252F1E|nr:guided entry of tail-anchored proteins factor 1-like [Athalia rosae]